MPGSFFDSNVLLYAAGRDPLKAGLARSRIADGGVISVQVLNEVVNVGRNKLRLDWNEIGRLMSPFRAMLTVTDLTPGTHDRGVALARRYGFSIYDAMIVAAALAADCDTLWSEDMQDGLIVDDRLTICNPFA
jgi:predicted nucleic acid-binding protein